MCCLVLALAYSGVRKLSGMSLFCVCLSLDESFKLFNLNLQCSS